jgi:hypothetical protein
MLILLITALFFILACGGGGGGGNGRGGSSPGSNNPMTQDSAPSFDRTTGYFVDPILITMSSGIAGAALEYTTDLTDPSCGSSTAYASPKSVTVSADTTIKVISCKSGYEDSAITTATYTQIAVYTRVSPGAGTPIQDAIDAATAGDIIFIEPGTFTEDNNQIDIDKKITLIGHGTEQPSNTIIDIAAAGAANPIFISTGGTSAADRLAVRNMVVSGSLGTGNDGIGLEISTIDGHIEIDNVTATGNGGDGIGFNISGETQDVVIINSTMSNNGNHGFRFPSSISNVDGLTIDNCVFENNTGAGAMFYNLGDGGVTNISITNSSFSNNATASYQNADLILTGFLGNAVISNITIDSNGSDSAIRISGISDGLPSPRGGKTLTSTISLSDITINGMQQSNGAYPAGALVITRYDDLTNLSMNNVVLNSTAPHGLFLGTITTAGPDLGNLELNGTFADSDIKLGKHGNSSSYVDTSIDIDATGATFLNAASDADIEARVWHNVDDAALGLVTWTTP